MARDPPFHSGGYLIGHEEMLLYVLHTIDERSCGTHIDAPLHYLRWGPPLTSSRSMLR